MLAQLHFYTLAVNVERCSHGTAKDRVHWVTMRNTGDRLPQVLKWMKYDGPWSGCLFCSKNGDDETNENGDSTG